MMYNKEMNNKQNSIDDVAAQQVSYTEGVQKQANEFAFNIVKRHVKKGNMLEIGASEGVLSEKLLEFDCPLDLLDGSSFLCERLKEKFSPRARVFDSLIEDFVPDTTYDNIVMSHVLEHVDDPVAVLLRAREWLSEGGLFFIMVPNAMSLHRQAAVLMELLPSEDTLNETDIKIGHHRVYNPDSFRDCLKASKLNILHHGGYWIKTLPNAVITNLAADNESMFDAFLRLGEKYPDIAAEIYAVATRKAE